MLSLNLEDNQTTTQINQTLMKYLDLLETKSKRENIQNNSM